MVNGSALSWAADAITIKGVANLATSGNSVSATVTFADPNTAATILTPKSAVVASSADALDFSIDTGSLIAAAATTKIDVGAVTGFPGKTRFSPDGSLSNAGGQQWFAPGQIKVGVKAGVKSLAASGTAFTWVNTDTGTVTLNGNFNAFTIGVEPECVNVRDKAVIRSSVGASILWNSPLGPIRFDYAYALSKDEGEKVFVPGLNKYGHIGKDQTQAFRFSGGSRF